jgi:hypothetical protein
MSAAAWRSAERRCQHLNALEPLAGVGLAYINRLSDLLFVMARVIARRQGLRRFFGSPRRNPKLVALLGLLRGQPAKRSAASLHNQASGQTPESPPHLAHPPPKPSEPPQAQRHRAEHRFAETVDQGRGLFPTQRLGARMSEVGCTGDRVTKSTPISSASASSSALWQDAANQRDAGNGRPAAAYLRSCAR